LNEVFVTKRA